MRCGSEVQRETRSAVGSGVSPVYKARRTRATGPEGGAERGTVVSAVLEREYQMYWKRRYSRYLNIHVKLKLGFVICMDPRNPIVSTRR